MDLFFISDTQLFTLKDDNRLPRARFNKEVQPTLSLNLNSELTYPEMGNSEFSVSERLNCVSFVTLSRLTEFSALFLSGGGTAPPPPQGAFKEHRGALGPRFLKGGVQVVKGGHLRVYTNDPVKACLPLFFLSSSTDWLLCMCCTHEPVLNFICGVCVQHVQQCSEQASLPVVNIRPTDRTGMLSMSDRAE